MFLFKKKNRERIVISILREENRDSHFSKNRPALLYSVSKAANISITHFTPPLLVSQMIIAPSV